MQIHQNGGSTAAVDASASGWSCPDVGEPWKLLIADDDDQVHEEVRAALGKLELHGRGLSILDAHTAEEALDLLRRNPDVAMILMDADIDSIDGSLPTVAAIRRDLNNRMVRVVLLSDEQRKAEAMQFVPQYDINDLRERHGLTAQRIFTLIYNGLTHFHELQVADRTREGLNRIAGASDTILRRRFPQRLARGALQLLCSILGVEQYAEVPRFSALMVSNLSDSQPNLLSGIGAIAESEPSAETLEALRSLDVGAKRIAWQRGSNHLLARFQSPDLFDFGLYLHSQARFKAIEPQVIELFCRNVANALAAADARNAMERAQNGVIMMLSQAIEMRSPEAGNHVRRVGEYSRMLGRLCGLGEEQADILLIGAALHDAGKVAIPDSILEKPGELTADERQQIERHAEIGGSMFVGSDVPVFQAATIIATQHHERWDGKGYPHGLKGEEIHLFGRIVAIADVFDALCSHRCYKKAWPLDQVLDTLRQERGQHFDPKLIDLFLENLPEVLRIRDRFVDPPRS